ncbi:MAG: GNAT family N-acetyltransferase [Candidatus Bathyarchaeota archaeon]|nr:GNAT family N-acetyltransferase [Candidatus Bathyarchaeota archaeon]MDW8039793.1 GNAT family N-acetyltransferase [Nitrososphaerota archaeon]
MSIRVRSLCGGELSRLVELINRVYERSYEFIPFNVDSLEKEILRRGLVFLVAEQGDAIVGCVGYGRRPRGTEIEWIAASDDAVRDALVQKVEENAEGEVFTAVDAGSPMMEFWSKRGYMAEGGLYHMTAELDGVKPLPETPAGTVFRSLKPGEEKKLIEVVNTSYGWERLREDSLTRLKAEHPPFSEEWVHVAEVDSKIVSAVVSRPDTEYNAYFHAKRGYLGPAATLPEYRGKNLASALTRRAMNFLYEKGMTSVSLYTFEGNVPSITLLKKLGFRIQHHWKFVHKNPKGSR